MEREIEYEIEVVGVIEDSKDDAVDVYITMPNGEKFIATFFTITKIQDILDKNKTAGDQLNDIYFWASDMIILREITLENIKLAIDDLIKSHGFYQAAGPANELAWKKVLEVRAPLNVGRVFNPPLKL